MGNSKAEGQMRRLLGVPDKCPLGLCDGWGIDPEGDLCQCFYIESDKGGTMGKAERDAIVDLAGQVSRVESAVHGIIETMAADRARDRRRAEVDDLAQRVRRQSQELREVTGRFVQISILGPERLYGRRWDALDDTPRRNLQVGARVLFTPVYDGFIPVTRVDGKVEGIVVALGRGQREYMGPWSKCARVTVVRGV